MAATLDEIRDNFAFLDDWDDRMSYVIELGRALPPFPEEARTDANKVRGCASQVWLSTRIERADGEPRLVFVGDSDAFIVRGLIAILEAAYSGRPAREILAGDPEAIFDELDLKGHLTAQRSNGLRSMVDRIRREAAAAG
ncbi:SufE family protein [Oharaeibacter diazotrophicus]|uniref:Cysteine desulfuration protein SufE n=1 Tax=Oharaeibacter diazotrophicus TaxID=1920512 RepID=A0A4R6RB98_9HYPH|nr:SufE family protein [Oharaeibacter diazotrophicus]TDP83255.1 cysteine desulfuration protein SufE [Oharaeibacter diazotrophicus]BBE72088.1 sulfur acceptor protein CsdE [Pleomorphomonas sp. SM30]GLS78853.1 cysteine desulfurization protein SufE [Oharaeibacter diazotrophicus]